MKKLLLALSLVLGVIVLLPSKVIAQDYSYTDYIRNFRSDIRLNQDASISIKENIDYHFTLARHGIYREIPTNYKVSGSFTRPTLLKLNDLYYFETKYSRDTFSSYERSMENGYTIFKIGDADTTITGDYTYVLDYKLTYAINYFDDHDELYINVTGTGWDVPINEVNANITVPGKITDKVCYTGPTDSTASNCVMTDTGANTLSVKAGSLGVYEGLTVVVAMAKGTIADTTDQQRVQYLLANLGILLPILTVVILFVLLKTYNKNKKITVIPHYVAPKNLNLLSAGYIYKKSLANNMISAQIIDFAVKGYIKIKQLGEREYELIKTEKTPPVNVQEKDLYDALFGVLQNINLKKLKGGFSASVTNLRYSLDKEMYLGEFFSRTKRRIANGYLVFAIIGIFGVIVSSGIFAMNAAFAWFWGLLLSFIAFAIFSAFIDKRTTEGNAMFYELEGLKMYINTAEKHRIEFHDNPKKYLGVFESLLPYAMIFGLEKKWAKEFEDLYVTSPDWYEGSNHSMFNSYILATSLGRMGGQVSSYATPTNSANGFSSSHGGSGGSGFSGGSSGGGFGGGGGGSW